MSFKLEIPAGLRAEGMHGYSPDGDARKRAFHRDGRRFLKALAGVLGLPKGSFEIRSNPAGNAGSGEVVLHGETLYILMCEGVIHPGVSVLYRRCCGRGDFCGETNQFVSVTALLKPARLERFVTDLRILGGLLRDLPCAA